MRGVVVAPQPMAADVGAGVLDRGGNAFDAAIATAFMQMAVDPFMCGIGGYGIGHLFDAQSGETIIVDFFGTVGSRASTDMWTELIRTADGGGEYVEGSPNEIGHTSSTTPGTVAGMAEIHRRWGSLPWAELLQPAIEALRGGFPLPAYVEDYYGYPFPAHRPGFVDWLKTTPAMAALWFREDGSLIRTGDLFRNPDYAGTLAILAEQGAEDFYTGSIARRIAEDMAANGGHVTSEDLAAYRPVIREPVRAEYRGYQVCSSPPPASGAIMLQMLRVLEGFDLRRLEHYSADYLALLARAMEWGLANQPLIADPAFVKSPVEVMLRADTVRAVREAIVQGRRAVAAPDLMDSGTTHLTVCDRAGNIAAITHSLGIGSGVVTPGLGFQYNSAVANFDPRPGRPASIQPGKREWRGHTPTIVLSGGRPFMALGSPGGHKIITAVLQTILGVVDYQMTPTEAVSAPRLYAEAGKVRLEARVRRAAADHLRAQGYQVNVVPRSYDPIQGRIQLVVIGEDGTVTGASDPRRDGGIAAYSAG